MGLPLPLCKSGKRKKQHTSAFCMQHTSIANFDRKHGSEPYAKGKKRIDASNT
ncbi:hypothetical protein ZHAS_00007281 [Anopheles sinensis]|uniref:Uncharacterized protein n=1 Tax=Anopheles sinensis TaxID=74873 RepID=A0A084VPK9_ANOSI|nr:hypothetical protein ZHAS_00007281 [Anopheles sinensis]